MTNYKLLTGAFEGSVIEEGTQIMDVDFSQLDDDLQMRITEWAELAYKGQYAPVSMNLIKQDYEESWESEETEEDADLLPISKW